MSHKNKYSDEISGVISRQQKQKRCEKVTKKNNFLEMLNQINKN